MVIRGEGRESRTGSANNTRTPRSDTLLPIESHVKDPGERGGVTWSNEQLPGPGREGGGVTWSNEQLPGPRREKVIKLEES